MLANEASFPLQLLSTFERPLQQAPLQHLNQLIQPLNYQIRILVLHQMPVHVCDKSESVISWE